jgi:nucleoside-diphosphate kinase
MSKFIERTLVLLKPDAVQRQITGRVISRFEDAGIKIIAMKMKQASKETALCHYDEKIAKAHGEAIREQNIDFLISGPVVAMVLEGVNVVENVRKMVGSTEPKSSAPGTIRGDFAHMSYAHADFKGHVAKNIIHASGNKEEAETEINIWFSGQELVEYKTVHELHTH